MLSALFQEKIVTKQGVEDFTPRRNVWPLDRLVQIRCTKPPDVVKRTAELLAEAGNEQERMDLEGQWVLSICCCYNVVCGVVCTYNPSLKLVITYDCQSGPHSANNEMVHTVLLYTYNCMCYPIRVV